MTTTSRKHSRVQMLGLLDDLGKGVMNAASQAVTGMSNEERDAMVAKMCSGRMDFNDYLKMSMMMQNQGGASGIMNSVNNIPGLKSTLGMDDTNMDETEAKLAQYSKIIAAMTEEERQQPGYFLVGEGAGARISKLAEAAELEEAMVNEFLDQFRSMKAFFVRLGVGIAEGKTKEQVAKEMEREAKEKEDGEPGKPQASKNMPFINPARKAKKEAKLAAMRRRGSRPRPPAGGPRPARRSGVRR